MMPYLLVLLGFGFITASFIQGNELYGIYALILFAYADLKISIDKLLEEEG